MNGGITDWRESLFLLRSEAADGSKCCRFVMLGEITWRGCLFSLLRLHSSAACMQFARTRLKHPAGTWTCLLSCFYRTESELRTLIWKKIKGSSVTEKTRHSLRREDFITSKYKRNKSKVLKLKSIAQNETFVFYILKYLQYICKVSHTSSLIYLCEVGTFLVADQKQLLLEAL